MSPTVIVIAIVVLAGLYIWFVYNSLVTARVRVKEAWSGIDVQLKRRSSLIPNLVTTVKAYAKHEKQVFEDVTRARSAMLGAKGPKEAADAHNQITAALKTLFAIAENYPQLRASENFKELQEELSDTETKVAASRQFYNANVMDYNTKIKVFPNLVFASMFGFTREEFFEAEGETRKDVEVKL